MKGLSMNMYVIAGQYKGRKLKMPKTGLRPTTNIVREALFDILGSDITGKSFLDVFAGSGLVGIEALSRGAAHVEFVEKDRNAADTIKENLKTINVSMPVHCMDFRRFFKNSPGEFNYLFFSPPYYLGFESEIIKNLIDYTEIYPKSISIIQIFKKIELPVENTVLNCFDMRKYGITHVYFIQRQAGN